MSLIPKEKQTDYVELELEDGIKHDEEIHPNEDNSEEIESQEMLSTRQKKRSLLGCVLLLIVSTIFIIALMWYYLFYNTKKLIYQYNDTMLEQCPSHTYILNQLCYDECPDQTYQRANFCVFKCQDSDYFINNKCVISSCSDINNQSANKANNYSTPFYDFSTHQCVASCLSASFKLFGEFCFETGCPKKEIQAIMEQYYERRSNKQIPLKKYDQFIRNFKSGEQNDLIITSNVQKQECHIGCQLPNKNFVLFNNQSGRYECAESCESSHFIYSKFGENICFDKCPNNTYISAVKNECLDSCGDYFIQNNKCVRNCNSDQFQEGQTCVYQCSKINPYIYKDIYCTNTCQNFPETPYVYQKKCVSSCPFYMSAIQGLSQAYQCVSSCDLLSSGEKHCADKCEEGEVEVVDMKTNQRKCLKIETCKLPSQVFVPHQGCKDYCTIQYPFRFKQQCLQSCFQNQFMLNNECLENCPQSHPFSENGKCVNQCGYEYFRFEKNCLKQCPESYWKDNNLKVCSQNCSGVYVLPQRDCYQKCPLLKPFKFNQECLSACPNNYSIFADQNNDLSCFEKCPPDTYTTPQNQCVKECPQNLFKMKDQRICVVTCPSTYDENKECKNICEANQRLIIGQEQCFNLCPQSHFKLENKNECVVRCPVYSYVNKQENQCTNNCSLIGKFLEKEKCIDVCPSLVYNGACFDECPFQNLFIQNKTCVFQCEKNKISHQKQCLDNCPTDLYLVEDAKRCEQQCPNGYFTSVEEKVCRKECKTSILDDRFCVKECPFYSSKIKNICYSNNQNIAGPFLNESKEEVIECPFEQGYYSEERVCKKCKGGDECKKCSILFGLCLECREKYSLFNDQCLETCPAGFIDKQGICIKDDDFLRNNLYFREYTNSQFINPTQRVKYSILQDVNYINQELDEFMDNQTTNQFDTYTPTVLVHLHDLNSTYLDFYWQQFNHANLAEQISLLEQLKLSVLNQGLSILTVQSTEVLFFENFFQIILNEILPSLGYFRANIIFSGVGVGANSISHSVSQILLRQQNEDQNRNILGNYLIDMQLEFDFNFLLREMTMDQQEEIKNYVKVPQQQTQSENVLCQIFKPYLKLVDVTYTYRYDESKSNSLSNPLAKSYLMNNCREQDKQQKHKAMINQFFANIHNYPNMEFKFKFENYTSYKRKELQYQYIQQNLLEDIIQWKNLSSEKEQ